MRKIEINKTQIKNKITDSVDEMEEHDGNDYRLDLSWLSNVNN